MNPRLPGTSTSPRINLFLQHCTVTCRRILAICSITEFDSSLLIVPPFDRGGDFFDKTGNALRLRRRILINAARQIGIKHLTMNVGNGIVQNYPIPQPNSLSTIMHKESGIITPQKSIATVTDNFEVFQELYGFPGAASLVRMSDNQGLLSNQKTEIVSGVRPNDWLRLKHEDYWLPGELSEYQKNLRTKTEIRGYRYVAKLVTGVKCQYEVDARLLFYNGDLARLVKVHSCVPIE